MTKFPCRAVLAAVPVVAVLVLGSGVASASTGQLTFEDCFADAGADGCEVPDNAALAGAAGVATSSDGNSIYVTSFDDSSLSRFSRDPVGGQLTFEECFADTSAEGCQVPSHPALAAPRDVAVSADADSVYVVSADDDSLSHFSHDPVTGNLTFEECFADTAAEGCQVPAKPVLDGAFGVATSPDGNSVYVASLFDDSLSHFSRDTTSGNLSFQDCFADTAAEGCQVPAHAALDAAIGVGVEPGSMSVYLTSGDDDSLSHFSRDPVSGQLTFQDCFADTNAEGCQVPAKAALDFPFGLAVSGDGSSLYVASQLDDSLSHFARDSATGSLSFEDCFADSGAAGCPVPALPVLDGALDVSATPDGRSVYVVGGDDDSLSHFPRDPITGQLSFEGCFADSAAEGCQVPAAPALDGAVGVAASPDNRSVYLTSGFDHSLSRFTRELPPPPTAPPAEPAATPDEPPPSPTEPLPSPIARCGGKPVTKVATSQRDSIEGTPRADVILALGGNDRVRGLAGRDFVCGGKGMDTLAGGRGGDKLRGGKGNDTLRGMAGKDGLRGGRGRDVLRGGRGRDSLAGGRGLDSEQQR